MIAASDDAFVELQTPVILYLFDFDRYGKCAVTAHEPVDERPMIPTPIGAIVCKKSKICVRVRTRLDAMSTMPLFCEVVVS